MNAPAVVLLLAALSACSPTAHYPAVQPQEHGLLLDKRGEELPALRPRDTLIVAVTIPLSHYSFTYFWKKCYRRNDSIVVKKYVFAPDKEPLIASPVANFPVYWVANKARLVGATAVSPQAFRSEVDSLELKMRRFKAFNRRLESDQYFLYKNDSTFLMVNDQSGLFRKANSSWLIQ